MRHYSKKRRAREDEARGFRRQLIADVGCCEHCGVKAFDRGRSTQLCVHEIANGPLRQKALDKPYAVLVLCWPCNLLATDKRRWSEAAQLACLQRSRPDHYDLAAYNFLVNERAPNRITQQDVIDSVSTPLGRKGSKGVQG